MKVKPWLLIAALAVSWLLFSAGISTPANAQATELGYIEENFGQGGSCGSGAPAGFVLSYGLFDAASISGPVATIFDGVVIPPSGENQIFDLFPADDPDFATVASALSTGGPAGTHFGYSAEFCGAAGGFGPALYIGGTTGATIEFFRLTVPPFSVVESSPGFFEINPSTSQFTLAAFGSSGPVGPDSDGDGISDPSDVCPFESGPPWFGGCPDADSDGIPEQFDACPLDPGPLSFSGCPDSDGDGTPDNLDTCPLEPGPPATAGCNDSDGDGTPDPFDSCPNDPGPPDSSGCPDADGDGIPDPVDACPFDQGLPDFSGCPDTDGDGTPDPSDNCPFDYNDQADTDGDGPGDACDSDDDNDGLPDNYEAAHACLNPLSNDSLADLDGDGLNNTDEFAIGTNPCNGDTDNDGLGDGAELAIFPFGTNPLDPDTEDDGHLDGFDNCPAVSNPGQEDLDGDGQGDVCDPDDDNDGLLDNTDNCPFLANSDQGNNDGDGLGNSCDSDDDNDGLLDNLDNCPLTSTGGFDADGDGCRDKLAEFSTYVNGLPGLPDNVRNTILNKAADAQHLLCDVGNVRGGLNKLGDLRDYISANKKIDPGTVAILTSYVDNLIAQIELGQAVCP